MTLTLEDKVGIVTGGGGGIGSVTASLLASLGAKVVVSDINLAAAEEAVARIDKEGGKAVAQQTDLMNEASVVALIDRAVSEFGRLDFLDNNAAMTDPDWFGRDVEIINLDVEVWDRAFATNARGTMLACKYALPHIIKSGGSIVNIATASGLAGDAITSAYGCSKAAVMGLTMYIAAQHLKDGIRCNAVAPGLVLTPTARDLAPPDVIESFDRHMTRIGDPIDIAHAVAFLVSDYGSFINGQVISADGGLLKHMPNLRERQETVRQARQAEGG